MELKLKINFDKDATFYDVEAALENVFVLAQTAAGTNAAKTTVSFDDKKPVFTLQLDEELRDVLRLDVEAALEVVNGATDDQDAERIQRAKRTVWKSKVFCSAECDAFRSGTCPFTGNEAACPKYK